MTFKKITGSKPLIVSVFLILVGSLILYAWLRVPLPLERTVQLKIKQGMTGREIAELLHEEGIISSVPFFRLALWLKGAGRNLRWGTVKLSPPLTHNKLIKTLQRKQPFLIQVKLREGWPSWKTFSYLARKLDLPRNRFQKLARDKSFLDEVGVNAPNLEGYLFPNTYSISAEASHRKVLRLLVKQFHEVKRELNLRSRARRYNFSVHEAVTLASIIAKETSVTRERPLISAVFHNRLAEGRPLQADPTLLYSVENFQASITQSMLRKKGEYNTYVKRGLPPTPICNPGKASLRASVNPADVPYQYFVSKGDGTHAFSKSLREHRRSVKRYQDD